jgi:hypothetical protein
MAYSFVTRRGGTKAASTWVRTIRESSAQPLPWLCQAVERTQGDAPLTDPDGERQGQGRVRSAVTDGQRCQAKVLSAGRFRHCRGR